jgi:DNA-binding response OmpR family regulator
MKMKMTPSGKASLLRMIQVIERCSCCGQIIPPKVTLPRVKQRIYDYIARHPEGVSREQIIDAVYGHDPRGGPTTLNVVSVHVKKMRPMLKLHGVTITSPRGPGSTYRVEKCK